MLKLEAVTLILVASSFGLRPTNSITMLITLEIFCVLLLLILVLLGLEIFYCFLLMCIAACEAAVGLGTLISLMRSKSNANLM